MLNLSGHEPLIPETPYPRERYLLHGLALMLLKCAVDFLVIWAVTGTLWTPIDYVLSLSSLQGSKSAAFPSSLNLWLLIWTLPFICLGVVLSVRRARDAALPPWIVVAFFVPVLNYALMALLAAWPTKTVSIERPVWPEPAPVKERRSEAATVLGILAGVVAGMICVGVGVRFARSYGLALFLGGPFLVGAASAFVADTIDPRGRPALVVLGSLGALAGGLLLLAFEGVICMAMALPIALPLALLGGIVGQSLARGSTGLAGMGLLIALAPSAQFVDRVVAQAPTRMVYSDIIVDAPAARVWEHVIRFSDIERPPAWYFRTGLAYPLRARIEGSGVGAVRWCEFTTGAFREPITAWEPPFRLAFDVTDQPPPLVEWSPYRNVYAPHLDGFFRTTKGEFRLVALPDGRTRLEGRTWYSVRMQPQLYWTAISDAIIHRIHIRVLDHIRIEAERPEDTSARAPSGTAR